MLRDALNFVHIVLILPMDAGAFSIRTFTLEQLQFILKNVALHCLLLRKLFLKWSLDTGLDSVTSGYFRSHIVPPIVSLIF